MHPLRHFAAVDDVISFLQVFRRCRSKRKPDFSFALRETLLKEMEIDMPESDRDIIKDPYLILGYGVNAYFSIMWFMMRMFIAVTIFCIPIYKMYKDNASLGLKDLQPGFKYNLNQFMLGNLGAADTVCKQKRLGEDDHIALTCTNGQNAEMRWSYVDENKVKRSIPYGVMSAEMSDKIYCKEEAIWDHSENDGLEKCSDYIDYTYIDTQLKDKCGGKKGCTLNFGDIHTYGQAGSDFKLYKSGVTIPTECLNDAVFFIQTPCEIDHNNIVAKQEKGLLIACIAVFIYQFVSVYFDFVKCWQQQRFVEFDVKTITAGDYSVEFDLDHEIYENFKKDYYDETNPMSELAQFKLYIQLELEQRITDMPDQGTDPDSANKRIKIAQITFAFHNEKIIKWLSYRGTYIKQEKWDKVTKIEDQIDDAL